MVLEMAKKKCTWVDCDEVAEHPQIGDSGNMWANLCSTHNKELEDNLLDAKGILRCWIKASGGAKILAYGMVGGSAK